MVPEIIRVSRCSHTPKYGEFLYLLKGERGVSHFLNAYSMLGTMKSILFALYLIGYDIHWRYIYYLHHIYVIYVCVCVCIYIYMYICI